MNNDNILIRNARIEDAHFIGRCLLAAMELLHFGQEEDCDKELIDSVTKGCQKEDELYSYKRARIAESDETPIGCLISYDGKDYKRLREVTFERLLNENGLDLTNNPQETEPGEYYLDCMAIIPEYRGQGIGHLLMEDGIQQAKDLGIGQISLLVDSNHHQLKKYYQKLGFTPLLELEAFGNRYIKMECRV